MITKPNDPRTLYQYGRVLDAKGKTKLALNFYRKASKHGSVMAQYRIGMIYYYGDSEVKKNYKKALSWYKLAADKGFNFAKREVALMLDNGQGISIPDHEQAALYWRSLADIDNAEAAEKVALAIKEGKIVPLNSKELVQRLKLAADKRRVVAAYTYSGLLKESTQKNISEGAKYSLLAYRLAQASSISSEGGWIVYQWGAFVNYEHFIQAGAKNKMPKAEYIQAKKDFPKNAITFTVPVKCGKKQSPFQIYVWEWTRDYPQVDLQAEWVNKTRGCKFPQDVVESFRKIYSIADKENVSFPELAKYTLSKQNEITEPKKTNSEPKVTLKQDPKQVNSNTGLSSGDTAALGATAVAGLACWYWSEECKELGWEVVKQSAAEMIKNALD